jgi:hypothetical protein
VGLVQRGAVVDALGDHVGVLQRGRRVALLGDVACTTPLVDSVADLGDCWWSYRGRLGSARLGSATGAASMRMQRPYVTSYTAVLDGLSKTQLRSVAHALRRGPIPTDPAVLTAAVLPPCGTLRVPMLQCRRRWPLVRPWRSPRRGGPECASAGPCSWEPWPLGSAC